MGRPAKTNPRIHQLNISLTEAEDRLVRARAAALEMRLVDYGRLMLLRRAPRLHAPPAAHIDRITYEQLKRLGNNLNQIARVANATHQPPPPALEALLADIRAALGRGRIL